MSELISRLNHLLQLHAGKRVDGKVASHGTTTSTGETLRTCFRNLVDIGYKIQEPKNLTSKHIQALCEHWYKEKIAISTIQERLSRLRVFCGWLGKRSMVKSLPVYLPDVPPSLLKVRTNAQKSKGWTENGIDVAAKINEADRIDLRFGLMLRMMLAFGLRRMEVLHLHPWKSDQQTRLAIYHAKNGRPRDIPIDSQAQRTVLDQVKCNIPIPDALGWPLTLRGKRATLAYNIRLYNRRMAAIGITRNDAGVTGHGLRAQYAENAALMMHLIPPTLGGTAGQLPKDMITLKRQKVSELLGHSRIGITGRYYGSFARKAKPDEGNRAQTAIAKYVSTLTTARLPECPPERHVDALLLISELGHMGIDITLRQIHQIWCGVSARHGVAWLTPNKDGNLEMIEVAARVDESPIEENKCPH